jgi:ankyrin
LDLLLLQTGQTPLSIAQQLGYISVVEILKQVTQVVVTTTTTVQYRMLSPEVMQEAAMSDDEEGQALLIFVCVI